MSINRDELKIGVRRWKDSGCHAHPCKADGSKIPLSVPKGSQEQDENGEYRYGWKRLATGELPARTADQINQHIIDTGKSCLLYTSPSPRDATLSRMPSSA